MLLRLLCALTGAAALFFLTCSLVGYWWPGQGVLFWVAMLLVAGAAVWGVLRESVDPSAMYHLAAMFALAAAASYFGSHALVDALRTWASWTPDYADSIHGAAGFLFALVAFAFFTEARLMAQREASDEF